MCILISLINKDIDTLTITDGWLYEIKRTCHQIIRSTMCQCVNDEYLPYGMWSGISNNLPDCQLPLMPVNRNTTMVYEEFNNLHYFTVIIFNYVSCSTLSCMHRHNSYLILW